MKIPLGELGNQLPGRQPGVSATTTGGEQMARAIGNLGQGIGQVADVAYRRAAIEATNARYQADSHSLQLDQLKKEIADKVSNGEMTREQASTHWDEQSGKIDSATLGNVADSYQPRVQQAMEQSKLRISDEVSQFLQGDEQRELRGKLGLNVQVLDQQAALPGSDIAGINAKLDSLLPVAALAGIPQDQAAQLIQNAKDRNWTNSAVQRADAYSTSRDLTGLRQMEQDLGAEDGFYTGKLGAEQRGALLRGVQEQIGRVEAYQQMAADRADARAGRQVSSVESMMSAGAAVPPQLMTQTAQIAKGTRYEAPFQQLMQDGNEIQQVLRKPLAEQQAALQQKAGAIQGGGDAAQIASYTRLSNAVQANTKLLRDNPLQWAQQRTGAEVQPLDFAQLASGKANTAWADQMATRASTINALQKSSGVNIPMRPLLPQEVGTLKNALDQAAPQQQVQLFGALRQAFGADDVYMGAMQQIAPDAPVRAMAGMLAVMPSGIARSSGAQVAQTMLSGDALLSKIKADKAADGKSSFFQMPAARDFTAAFNRYTGDAFHSNPGAKDAALQGVRAYYAGRSAETSRDSDIVDPQLMTEAMRATIGEVVDINGNGDVVAPLGMDASEFLDRAAAAFSVATLALPQGERLRYGAFGLENARNGVYRVRAGNNYLLDAQNNPLTINVLDPALPLETPDASYAALIDRRVGRR